MRPGIDFLPDYSEFIDEILNTEVLVRSNEGTFGAAECCRKVGTGDPRFGTRKVYETPGGRKRVVGVDEDRIPGRLLNMGQREMKELKERLKELRAEEKKYKALWQKANPNHD